MTETPRDAGPPVIAEAEQMVDPTGVRNLDLVLGGGLPRGALTLIVGQPGSGKTTLACQIAFAGARAGRRVLVLTALSEPVSKLLTHMRTLSFFDEDLVGDQLLVLSLDQFRTGGLAPTGDALVALAREEQASLVVLDGFRGVSDAAMDPHGTRQFLYDVGTTLGIAGTTTVITREADRRDTSFYPEGTTADVIVGLHARLDDVRQRRGLEVIKVRGAAPLPGLHGLHLSAQGATVYPRLESCIVQAPDPPVEGTQGGLEARASFDLPEFDALLGGGLTRKTVTLVIGSPGTGKTLLGLHFALAGVRAGEPVVVLGFHETRRELQLKASAFDLGAELQSALAPAGGITLLRHPPVELDPDALADELLNALDRTGARRLVVDSIAALERAVSETSDGRRVPNYLAALVEVLLERGVTTLFTKEHSTLAAAELRLPADLISVVASNVIWMQLVTAGDRIRRVLSVPKMRYSVHDDTLREFEIAVPFGIRVRAPFESTLEMRAESGGQQRLPTGADLPARASRPDDTMTPTPRGLVLIAEDEEPIAETIAYVVEEAGYTPRVAYHGRQALEMARAAWPALLITDLMMPYLNGAGLIAALRADAARSGTAVPPIILLTAASLTQARAAGADVVMRKPFGLAELEGLLHRLLGDP